MSVTQKFEPSTKKLTIKLPDRFNFDIYSSFRNAYRDITPQQVSSVYVDLSSTSYIDSAALGMLLLLGEHFKHTTVNITHCSEYIIQILEIANFSKKFNITGR